MLKAYVVLNISDYSFSATISLLLYAKTADFRIYFFVMSAEHGRLGRPRRLKELTNPPYSVKKHARRFAYDGGRGYGKQ